MSEFPIQVKKSHYLTREYNHKGRWIHYWQQINLVLKSGAKSILEIGPGIGIVTKFLKEAGFKIITIDIDPELKPDAVGSVLNMPFKENEFDLVLATEVLEHLPFEDFQKALLEIKRVTKKDIIISLPDHRRILFKISFKIPFIEEKKFIFRIPAFKKHQFDGQHHWEIGKIGFPVSKIKKEIQKAGLKIIRDFAPPDNPRNHYFILEK